MPTRRLSPLSAAVLDTVKEGYKNYFHKDGMMAHVPEEIVETTGEDAYPAAVRLMFYKVIHSDGDISYKFDHVKFAKMLASKDHLTLAKVLLAMNALDDNKYETMTLYEALDSTFGNLAWMAKPLVEDLELFVAKHA